MNAVPVTYALIGAAGYVAPKHLNAIAETGGLLIAACDIFDSVGILDRHFPEAAFFTSEAAFWRTVAAARPKFVVVCTPNHIHAEHVARALKCGADVICEKPLVIDPADLDYLSRLELETSCRIYPILQLRLHATLKALLNAQAMRLATSSLHDPWRASISLYYVTRRGPWYFESWKGDRAKSGGLAMNIGVHFFDVLIWIYGDVLKSEITSETQATICGTLQLLHADVEWRLSVDQGELPKGRPQACRYMTVDGEPFDFTQGFTELHVESYREILCGGGFCLDDARKALELVSTFTPLPAP